MKQPLQPCILIVDDDAALLEALPQALSLRVPGVQVVTSDSTLEALEWIQKYDYDVIVSDIKMPGMEEPTTSFRSRLIVITLLPRCIAPFKHINCDVRW
jgi:DNA-binding NtrC family response regulator